MLGKSVSSLLAGAIIVTSLTSLMVTAQVDSGSSRHRTNRVPARNALPHTPFSGTHGAAANSQSFPRMVRAAGFIFSGTVTKIASGSGDTQALPAVAITFRVENGIRGAMPGQEFTVSEWAGAWTGGQRYHVGERVMLFLYPRSKLGLTSSVSGPLGRFGVNARGRVSFSPQQRAAFAGAGMRSGQDIGIAEFAGAIARATEQAERAEKE